MSNKGMTGVEMWSELQTLHGFLIRCIVELDARTRKRKKIIKDMDRVAKELGKKIKLQAGQQHAN